MVVKRVVGRAVLVDVRDDLLVRDTQPSTYLFNCT